MSEEITNPSADTTKQNDGADGPQAELELTCADQAEADDEQYEEICSEEVDEVLEVLDTLIEKVASENIRSYLEDASSGIYYLIYDDDSDDGEEVNADSTLQPGSIEPDEELSHEAA